MALFVGHIANGVWEISLGLYWLYNLLLRFLLCRREEEMLADGTARKFCSVIAFPCKWFPSFPVVPVITCCIIPYGMISVFRERGSDSIMLSEHLTASVTFWIVVAYVAVSHYHRTLIPDGDYLLFILAVIVKSVLSAGHDHGASELEAYMHQFFFFLWVGMGAVTMLEMAFRRTPTIAVVRPILLILQGAWMFTIAFSLFSGNPLINWPRQHAYVLVANVVFAGCLLGGLLVLLCVYALVYAQVRYMSSLEVTNALDLEYRFQVAQYEKRPFEQETSTADNNLV